MIENLLLQYDNNAHHDQKHRDREKKSKEKNKAKNDDYNRKPLIPNCIPCYMPYDNQQHGEAKRQAYDCGRAQQIAHCKIANERRGLAPIMLETRN